MTKKYSDMDSKKEIEEWLPDYILSKRKLLLRGIKVIDLYDYMSEDKFSEGSSQNQSAFYIPFLSQPLLRNPKHFILILSKFISTNKQTYPQMTYNFFKYKSNLKHLNYFVQCCFPSLFNYFSSDEYSFNAYNFIKQYSKVEQQFKRPDSDDTGLLTTNKLIISYIIHNFQFRQIFFERFVIEILGNENINFEKIFCLLIDSFSSSISYLDQFQLKILLYQIQSSDIEDFISLLKQLFIRLIKIWRYTPQFCSNEFLGPVPDDPQDYSKNIKENDLIKFILNYEFKEEKSKIRKRFENLFNNSPYAQQNYIKDSLLGKKDKLILSDYDILLFSWIIMQGSDETPINGSNMIRNYPRQEEFSSKKSALRFFYVDFDIKVTSSNSEQQNARDRAASLYFIEKQIEACDQIKQSIILKYSDTNYLDGDKTYGQKFCEDQLHIIEKESNDKSFWKSNSNLFIFGQLFTYLNRREVTVDALHHDLNHIIDDHANIKYALSRSISFKNGVQSQSEQNLYYSGFRFLSIMEFSNDKYLYVPNNFSSFDYNNIIKALMLLQKIYKKIRIVESKNNHFGIDENPKGSDENQWRLDINECIQFPFKENQWGTYWKRKLRDS